MIDTDTLARMRRIGLNSELEQRLLQHSLETLTTHHDNRPDTPPDPAGDRPPALRWWRVTEVQREHLQLNDGTQALAARAWPRLLQQLRDEADALAVGDWVLAAPDAQGGWWVQQRLSPLNQISRRLHDGRDKLERLVIVSNVDVALLVMGLDLDFNLRRLGRYITLVRLARVQAGVVLTKADLCPQAEQRLAQVRDLLPPGMQAVAVAAQQPETVQALAPWLLEGRSLVLLGASGAGKSTLTNTLCQAPLQAVGGTRRSDGRGRHTTTARSLHITPQGACLIDTPGLRTLRLDTDEAAITEVFDDVSTLAPQCRFRNCRHEAEPGCAVREALSAERLNGYHKLWREARRDSLSALERQRQRSEWKQRGRAGVARAQAKRGG